MSGVGLTPNVKPRAIQRDRHAAAEVPPERRQALNRMPSLTPAPVGFNVSLAGPHEEDYRRYLSPAHQVHDRRDHRQNQKAADHDEIEHVQEGNDRSKYTTDSTDHETISLIVSGCCICVDSHSDS